MAKRRMLFRFGFAFLALLFTAGSLYFLALAYAQNLLTVDSGEARADVMVVLGGGTKERSDRAVELFKAGVAPRILVSGAGDNDYIVGQLESSGVPAKVITQEARSLSTLENARFSSLLLHQMGARRVILVTTWYHSRRAQACFEHFAPDITFYSRPSYFAYSRDKWNQRHIGEEVHAELIKLPGYWLWYGIWPYALSSAPPANGS